MLHHLSWAGYLKVVVLLLVIYYGYIFLKYFRSDFKKRFRKNEPMTLPAKFPPSINAADTKRADSKQMETAQAESSEANLLIEEADDFIQLVKKFIGQAAGKPFAPDALRINLENIFKTNKALCKSPHRPAINELVVSECERTGIALLTEEEVDRWWEAE